MKRIFACMIIVFCFVIASSGSGKQTYERTLKEFSINDISSISLRNINGDISLKSSDIENVFLKVVSKDSMLSGVSDEEFWKIYFSAGLNDRGLCLSVESVEQENGLFGGKDKKKAPSIDIMIEVPEKGFDLFLDTVNGDILLDSYKGNIEGKTVNGDIDTMNLNGQVSLVTVNGKIRLCLEEASGESKIRTVNGNIELYLNPALNLTITAKNVNGSIKADKIELAEIKSGRRYLKAVLNKPENTISLNTVNGSITLNNIVDKK